MTIEQAKEQAAVEFGWELGWSEAIGNYHPDHYLLSDIERIINRALEIYGQAKRTEGIKEGFKAARAIKDNTNGYGHAYPTVEDYLNK